MPDAHSKYSASGQEAATLCPGKSEMEKGKPDKSSHYADEGTAAHSLLADCLDEGSTAASHIGAQIIVAGQPWTVTEEMAAAVQTALDNIALIAGPDAMVLSEQRVNYARYLGVPADEAWGTSDVIAARGTELQVHDYKHGMGVEVSAGFDEVLAGIVIRHPNHQMGLYGLGALDAVNDTLGPFETVRLVIHQPRLKDAPSEYVLTVAELERWGADVAARSVRLQQGATIALFGKSTDDLEWQRIYLTPGEKQCKFCKAKATCGRLREESLATVYGSAPPSVDEFEQINPPSAEHIKPTTADWLAAALAKADLIDIWLSAVRAEAERRLLAGEVVPGFKLVQGKRGNRAWSNAAEAEALLKAMRLKVEEMYDLKLISPTSAEKLAPKFTKDGKPVPPKEGAPAPLIGPRQWPKLAALITQADGKPHVAPAADPRPALDIRSVADDFTTVATEAADFA